MDEYKEYIGDEKLENVIKNIEPTLIGTYARNFREVELQESVNTFTKKTDLTEATIYNFENGRNVSYPTFYEYVKRGFLKYIFG